jgi:hypothetical protein
MTTSQLIKQEKEKEQCRKYESELLKRFIQKCFVEQSKKYGKSS